MDMLLFTALFSTGVMKVRAAAARPASQITPRTRLVTDVASWQAKRWEVMPVAPYPSACCMETGYQVIPGDIIILNVWGYGLHL